MSGAITAGESILGKYLIREMIGEGGMARVWLAEESNFGKRQVAIKEPRADLSPDEQTEMQIRFRKEVSVCAALEQANAPYIVRAITAEPYAQQLLQVMAYMPGGDLAQRIAAHKEGMPIDQVIEIAESLLTALQAMHEHPMEIVHRDLKPSNVLFDNRGKAHLADFGVAQTATRTGVNTKLMGTAQVGTPLYMAPEQVGSSGYLTPAADIFTFGCILFEMVTGKRYKRHRPGTRVAQIKEDVPSWLDDLLDRALLEDPFDRYESAEEMLEALRSGAHQEAEKRRLVEEAEKRRQAEEAQAQQRAKEAKQWFDQGLRHHQNQEYAEAIADYSKAIELDPTNASYYDFRGDCYHVAAFDGHAAGDYAKAIADYSKAIELDRNNPRYYSSRGDSYMAAVTFDHRSGDISKAIADFTKAIELDPNDAIYYNSRGACYGWLEEYGKAIVDFTKAIELDPSDASYYDSRGMCYYDNDEYANSIADFTKAIGLQPNDAAYYYHRGISYAAFDSWAFDDYGKAIADFTKAIELAPNNASYYHSRGEVYNTPFGHVFGDSSKAIADFTKAIELDPNNASYYESRAITYGVQGDKTRYEADLARSIELQS